MPYTSNDQQGFTLVEIIAVLFLIGILAAYVIPKYVTLTEDAKNKAIDGGIAELNVRESITWSKVKLATGGWVDDAATFATVDTNLGPDYTWSGAPTVTGGAMQFQSGTAAGLTRTASTASSPGVWKRP